MINRDKVCEQFDGLIGEVYAWPRTDRGKPKEPVVINLEGPISVSPALIAQNNSCMKELIPKAFEE